MIAVFQVLQCPRALSTVSSLRILHSVIPISFPRFVGCTPPPSSFFKDNNDTFVPYILVKTLLNRKGWNCTASPHTDDRRMFPTSVRCCWKILPSPALGSWSRILEQKQKKKTPDAGDDAISCTGTVLFFLFWGA